MSRVLLILSILVFGFTVNSFADNEAVCMNRCYEIYHEDGAIEACKSGCNWQINFDMHPERCEQECFAVIGDDFPYDIAQEMIWACHTGCNQ
ncbi:MAG: hypothetical protein D6B25_08750 [Desulfobulbaceae bacterium]|nr:MAG: hypothetical protein D6B25_08750 [Desulfobulbaceae bacterium]